MGWNLVERWLNTCPSAIVLNLVEQLSKNIFLITIVPPLFNHRSA